VLGIEVGVVFVSWDTTKCEGEEGGGDEEMKVMVEQKTKTEKKRGI
jgi:hypothetical protein